MWRAGVSQAAPTHHAAYLVVAALAAEQLALGHDVIADAVTGPEPARAQWRDLARQLDAELKFIVVECGDDRIFRDRLEHRSRKIEGFPEPDWEGVLRRRAEFPPWTDERLTIDSVNSRAANLRAALEYLSAASAALNPEIGCRGARLDSHLGGARTLILPGRIGPATRESA